MHIRFMFSSSSIVVAVPVKNEELHILSCLTSLSQQSRRADHIILLLNNCTDQSFAICESLQNVDSSIELMTCELFGNRASAGEARRLVLDRAMNIAGHGIILTTDADSVPDRNWIADNIFALNSGADVVCGAIEINPVDASRLPCRLTEDDRKEKFLLRALDEISFLVDPDPSDPWPRHQQNSGASIAVKADFLRALGGAPQVATGEDRALISQLEMIDARVRHAPHIKVSVSGRIDGRAVGGMAATMKRRLGKADMFLDDALEPAIDAFRRARVRASLRAIRDGQLSVESVAQKILIDVSVLRRAARSPYFGAAWAQIQCESPVLHRRRVPMSALARESKRAEGLLRQIKLGDLVPEHSSPHSSCSSYSQADNVL